jgi:DNA sulfur modification protein DndC
LLPRDQLTKPIHVITSDTLVETPVIVDHIRNTLDAMNTAAVQQGMPIRANLVLPEVSQTFWVNMIGRGYPAPYNKFRWCTDRLKINPANQFIKDTVDKHGEVILVLGVRKAESATRRQVMELHKRVGNRLSRHSQLTNAWVFTPIEDWLVNDVWTYLLQNSCPWGGTNRALVTMYRNASGECPLVIDKTTPSCGSSRFGCWTCTVVDRDKSMELSIESGEDWMDPLLQFRNWLTATKNPEGKKDIRSHRRRTGRIDTWGDNKENIIWGPYKMEFREEILRRLLRTQLAVQADGPDPDMALISAAELHEIRRLWRTEEGDWNDRIPKIYGEEIGGTLKWVSDEFGGSTNEELRLLADVADEHDLPVEMLKEFIDIQRSTRGMSKRSRVHQRIERTLKKDWRSKEEVFAELEEKGNTQWTSDTTVEEGEHSEVS